VLAIKVNWTVKSISRKLLRVLFVSFVSFEGCKVDELCEMAGGLCSSKEHSAGSMAMMSRRCIRDALEILGMCNTKVESEKSFAVVYS
jgi:hypothetical protein